MRREKCGLGRLRIIRLDISIWPEELSVQADNSAALTFAGTLPLVIFKGWGLDSTMSGSERDAV